MTQIYNYFIHGAIFFLITLVYLNIIHYLCAVKLFNRFRNKNYYNFKFIEFDDGDAYASFDTIHGLKYLVELDWGDGIFDVEFGLANDETYDTTNAHDQYKVLNTVSEVVRVAVKRLKKYTGEEFHSLEFKSSKYRNGYEDNSNEIRDRFFIRFVTREYPNATIINNSDGSVLIRLVG